MPNDDERSEYTVMLNGIPHTLLLTDEAAKAYPNAKKATVANKAKAPANKKA
jgi:hypothetical protein